MTTSVDNKAGVELTDAELLREFGILNRAEFSYAPS